MYFNICLWRKRQENEELTNVLCLTSKVSQNNPRRRWSFLREWDSMFGVCLFFSKASKRVVDTTAVPDEIKRLVKLKQIWTSAELGLKKWTLISRVGGSFCCLEWSEPALIFCLSKFSDCHRTFCFIFLGHFNLTNSSRNLKSNLFSYLASLRIQAQQTQAFLSKKKQLIFALCQDKNKADLRFNPDLVYSTSCVFNNLINIFFFYNFPGRPTRLKRPTASMSTPPVSSARRCPLLQLDFYWCHLTKQLDCSEWCWEFLFHIQSGAHYRFQRWRGVSLGAAFQLNPNSLSVWNVSQSLLC